MGVPSFEYYHKGKLRVYYPDILLENKTFVEVKSTYTLEMAKSEFKAKIKAVYKAGYTIAAMVMDAKGNLLKSKVWRPAKPKVFKKISLDKRIKIQISSLT